MPITLSILMVAVVSALVALLVAGRLRRRRQAAMREDGVPKQRPLAERVAPSGRYKSVLWAIDDTLMKVEVYRWIDDEPTEHFWAPTGRTSLVDKRSAYAVLEEALEAASGERSE